MSQVLERDQPAIVFAEAADEFARRSPGTSVYTAEDSGMDRESSPVLDAHWVRMYLTSLLQDARRLNRNVRALDLEIPRIKAFRNEFKTFLECKQGQRKERRAAIAEQIRASAVPSAYIHEVLRQCTSAGNPDALDTAIDLLSGLDADIPGIFQVFLNNDRARWRLPPVARHANDDVCYVLLRALARCKIPSDAKLPLIEDCLLHGTDSIREAATHALADMGGDRAANLLKQAAHNDSAPLVRESAREALDDLDH